MHQRNKHRDYLDYRDLAKQLVWTVYGWDSCISTVDWCNISYCKIWLCIFSISDTVLRRSTHCIFDEIHQAFRSFFWWCRSCSSIENPGHQSFSVTLHPWWFRVALTVNSYMWIPKFQAIAEKESTKLLHYYHHLANKHSSSNWTTDAYMKKIDHENTSPYRTWRPSIQKKLFKLICFPKNSGNRKDYNALSMWIAMVVHLLIIQILRR